MVGILSVGEGAEGTGYVEAWNLRYGDRARIRADGEDYVLWLSDACGDIGGHWVQLPGGGGRGTVAAARRALVAFWGSGSVQVARAAARSVKGGER